MDLLVAEPMWLVGIGPKPLFPALLVNIEVSFADMHIAIALEGNDVSCKPIEKPAIVGDHNDTASEIRNSFFE
jgi:hypothetical protein